MAQPQHDGDAHDDAQRKVRYEVIDDEHLAQRNRQVHEPLQIYGLGALQFGEQADHPEEKKHGGDAEPDPHDDQRRCLGQAEGRAEQGAHEAQPAHHECAQSGEHSDDRAQTAAARPLIAREPPAQPEDGLELLPFIFSTLQPAQLLNLVPVAAHHREEFVLQRAGAPQFLHRALVNQFSLRDDADVRAKFLHDLQHV